MPQVNYETKIENVVKESANVDLNKLNVHIPGTLPKQIVEKHIEYDPTFSEAFLYRFTKPSSKSGPLNSFIFLSG